METKEPQNLFNPPTQPLVPGPPMAAAEKETTSPKATSASSRRKPLLTDVDPPPTSKSPTATSYIVKTNQANRPANQRRNASLVKLLVLACLANLLVVLSLGAWFYNTIQNTIDRRVAALGARPRLIPAEPSQPAVKPPVSNDAVPTAAAAANPPDAGYQDLIADLQAQFLALQKRLGESEQTHKSLSNRIEQVNADRLRSAAAATPPPSAVAAANNDLLLLKERNRLSAYADEAIATGARDAYQQLWKAVEEPEIPSLIHAARAEILRVQNYYLGGSRLERYDIAVVDYFPESAALRDTQLNDEQLIQLVSNPSHPWQVRLKAANLLGLRRSTAVGDALVEVIKNDPNLDVVKEATFSFEQLTGYRAQIFETANLEAWWRQYNEIPPPSAPPKKKTDSAPKDKEPNQPAATAKKDPS